MWETRWRVEMCTYLLCVLFSFEGLPLNGNFQDNNVNVYTLYCHRFEHDARLLSCRERKRCHVEQCGLFIWIGCWVSAGNLLFIKSARLIAKQVVGNIGVFCLTVAEKVQLARKRPTLYFDCNWKNILFWQRHTMEQWEIVISLVSDIDKWFFCTYFCYTPALYFTEMYWNNVLRHKKSLP